MPEPVYPPLIINSALSPSMVEKLARWLSEGKCVVVCEDCGLPYYDHDTGEYPHGLDITLPNDEWALIAEPETILCGTCIARRCALKVRRSIAIRATIAYTGPFTAALRDAGLIPD